MQYKAASGSEIPGPIPLKLIEEARERIKGAVLRTPLVRLNIDEAPAEIFLKLENLQPTGSFKVRGASNAIALAGPDAKKRGVYTCSAGNMAQALAWQARQSKIPCTVIVPDNAPETKLEAIRRFGANIIQASFDEVWKVVVTHRYPPLDGSVFIHPFADIRMMAGNGTAGLEILEDLPDVDSVVIPFGGGGLSVGIASAIHAKRPQTRVYAVEPETAAPLSASFAAGSAREIERVPSFVDGIGGKSVLPEMWERARNLLLPLVVSLSEIAMAVKLLVERNRIVAEGAGAASVAAAMTGKAASGKIVCIVSGGNIDSSKLGKILAGGVP
jgi:threonine dehydratase